MKEWLEGTHAEKHLKYPSLFNVIAGETHAEKLVHDIITGDELHFQDWLEWVEYNEKWDGAYDQIVGLGSIFSTYMGFTTDQLQRYYEKWWHWGREWFTLRRIQEEDECFDSEEDAIMDKHINMMNAAIHWSH